jgi:hypothetical protein
MAQHQKVNNEVRVSRMLDDLGITIPGLTDQKKEENDKEKPKKEKPREK